MNYNKIMYNIENLNQIFLASLAIFLKKRGTQAKLARSINKSRQFVSDLVSGRRFGSEHIRRKISIALGYHDYESFLDVGRKALGLPTIANRDLSKTPSWLEPVLEDLHKLDEAGQKAVKFLIKALNERSN